MLRFLTSMMCMAVIMGVVSLSSASAAEQVSPKVVVTKIKKAQNKTMNELFVKIEQLALQHANSRDFYAAIFGTKADDARLAIIPQDEKTPKFAKIENGMKITGQDGKVITIRLSRNLGEVDIQGMQPSKSGSAKKTAHQPRFMESLLAQLLPAASAGAWDWIISRGIGRVGDVMMEIWDAREWGRMYTNAERAALLAKGTAHLTAEAAIIGCLVAMHGDGDQKLTDCGYGATVGAGVAVGTVAAAGTVLGVAKAGEKAMEVAVDTAYRGIDAAGAAFDKLPVAKQLNIKKA